jgi:hypothetical protein
VARNQWKLGGRKLAIDDVQVRTADGTRVNPDQDLIRLRRRDGSLLASKGQAGPVEDHREHRPTIRPIGVVVRIHVLTLPLQQCLDA